ncbi:MAG: galactokinase [Fimbriimonadaceae bacterium]
MRESEPTRGDNQGRSDSLKVLKDRAVSLFRSKFGNGPEAVVAAPGRVNLIGEHTDYNDGFVFPAAIDRRIVVAASASPDTSKVWTEGSARPAVFDAGWEREAKGWGRFPAGCAWTLLRDGHSVGNINAAVVSDLPSGIGVSSSAAMEMAFLTLWNHLDGLGLDPTHLAKLGQAVEHRFIGVQCGIMDQLASALGREGHAMLLDTRSLLATHVPIPEGMEIVLCDTNKRRALGVTAYNERRAECESAAKSLGVGSLRDATMEMLDGTVPHLGAVIKRRARHVISENERCLRFAQALSDCEEGAIGTLMRASHESLRDDYEVSCPELDWMAESAWSAPGCVGARMTGAGFGGACVALVKSDMLNGFLEEAEKGFREMSNGLEPRFLVCRAAAGAGVC